MLLDASGSMSEVWAPVCREACAIVDALPQGARLTVMAFSADTHVLFSQCPLGSRADRAALKHQLTQYKPPFLGTHMGRALRCAVDALSDPPPRSPHLLAPVSAFAAAAAGPMILLATDGRSADAVDMADLLRRQPDLTVHVTAYTTDPDAAILAQLCRDTGGMYLFCPTADAAAHDQDLALQRAQQVLTAFPTPVLRTAITCTEVAGAGAVAGESAGAVAGASAVVDPQLMDMNRPLRPHPGAPLRLPFSADQACTFTLTMQCLDGTLLRAEAVWDPARPPAFCVQAQRDVDAARLAEAAQLSESEHSDAPLRALLQRLRAREDAAEAEFALGQAMDVALGVAYAQPQEKAQAQEQALSLARESVRKAEDLLARASMPAALPHLAAHLSSLSQGGNSAYGGGTSSSTAADEALQLATLLSQTLSQDPTSSTLVYEEDMQASKRARRE